MNEMVWVYFHCVMILILGMIVIISGGIFGKKENCKNLKKSDDKKLYSIIEMIIIFIIVMGIVVAGLAGLIKIALKNEIIAIWIVRIFGSVYVYLAIRQMVKIIFIPENRPFSISDINDFVYVYLFWGAMMAVLISKQSTGNMLDVENSEHGEIVKIGILLFKYYFNLFFALGGIYILFFYLGRFIKRLLSKYNSGKEEKVKKWVYGLWESGKKYDGLKCFRLWEKDNRKNVICKILMSIPVLMFDIMRIMYLLIESIVKMAFIFLIILVSDPIRILHKYFKKLWNSHQNNEWLYVFAQIAGLCSYVIVFIVIQYGGYTESVQNIYEFVGTIILIPYFLGKIVNVKKISSEK